MPAKLTPTRIEHISAWLGVFRDIRLPGMVNVSSQSLAEAADVIDGLATALAEAEARGRRQGLEEAAKVAENSWYPYEPDKIVCEEAAKAIRDFAAVHPKLATAPAETRESANLTLGAS